MCSGAIASPQLLQRSGVGRSTWLRELDVPLVHDLPGVGENLQDHLEMYMQYECLEPCRFILRFSGGTSRRSGLNGC